MIGPLKPSVLGHARTIYDHVVVETRWPVIEPTLDWLAGASPVVSYYVLVSIQST